MSADGSLRAGLTPGFREIALSSTGARIGEQITWVATILFAYNRNGAKSAGLFAAGLLLVAAFVTPVITATWNGSLHSLRRATCLLHRQ
jgi:hypothetical protein